MITSLSLIFSQTITDEIKPILADVQYNNILGRGTKNERQVQSSVVTSFVYTYERPFMVNASYFPFFLFLTHVYDTEK